MGGRRRRVLRRGRPPTVNCVRELKCQVSSAKTDLSLNACTSRCSYPTSLGPLTEMQFRVVYSIQ